MADPSGSGWVDFKLLKERVSIEQVLAHYGLTEKLTRKGDSLVGACPIHGGDNKSAFRASLKKNIYHCFVCNAGGNIIDLAAALEGVDVRAAALRLKAAFGIEIPAPRKQGRGGPEKQPPEPAQAGVGRPTPPRESLPEATSPGDGESVANTPLGFSLKHLDPSHPYLSERGLASDTIATFGIGFHTGKGIMQGRIAIPLHNVAGELVAYVGRFPGEPSEEVGKYRMPTGFKKSLELYNFHRARGYLPDRPLIVVEGFFDCMRLHQGGHPNVVAAMGASLSEQQLEAIVRCLGNTGRVIVLFDEDDAGRAGRAAATAQLAPRVYVRAPSLPQEGAQPEHLTASDLSVLLA